MSARHEGKRGGPVLHEGKPIHTTRHQCHSKMRSHAPSKPCLRATFLLRFLQQMDAPTLVANALHVNTHWIALALEGLTDDDLLRRPNAQCYPMGWTLWHQYRVEDRLMSAISGHEQVWIAGGWHARFALPADPSQIG